LIPPRKRDWRRAHESIVRLEICATAFLTSLLPQKGPSVARGRFAHSSEFVRAQCVTALRVRALLPRFGSPIKRRGSSRPGSPRVAVIGLETIAPLTVLSLGPRLAGTPLEGPNNVSMGGRLASRPLRVRSEVYERSALAGFELPRRSR